MTSPETPPSDPTLRLRYFFDAGSGVCLWAGNDQAADQYGYAIDVEALPLSGNTRYWLRHLIAWYDTSLDWDNPGSAEGPWPEDEKRRFAQAARRGLDLLRQELPPPRYAVQDETGAAG